MIKPNPPLSVQEVMRRALLKALEEAGMPASDSMSLVPASDLLATMVSYWSGQDDIVRQAIAIQDAGKVVIAEMTKDDPGKASELSYLFGVEVGKLVLRLEYSLPPHEANNLVAKREASNANIDKAELARFKKEVGREARARWQLEDKENTMRVGDMAEKIHDVLIARHRKGDPYFDYVPENEKKIAEWIRPYAPAYARKRGPKGPRKT